MKKLLSGITAMVLVLGLSTTGVQAKATTTITETRMTEQQVIQMVEQTNKEIYEEIDKADDVADGLLLSYEAANMSYKQLNEKLDKIIAELLKVTSKKTEKLIKEAGKSGYVIEPVWIDVEIGDRIVSVDPCLTDGF